MKPVRNLFGLFVSTFLLFGCANTKMVDIPQPWCTIAGTLIGAGAGIGVNEAVADNGEESDTRIEAGAAGAAFGAAASILLCGGDYPPKPTPVAAPAVPPPDPCAPDDDGDGVNNCADQCPSTPAGVAVDATGCPQPGETLIRLEGVNFAFDSAKLTAESEGILAEAVQELRDAPSVSVRVEGHTDSVGSDAYNLELSQRRAEAVVDYLISQGIEPHRLEPIGMGEGHPIDSNETDDGRYHNRRVDFVVSE